jgi:hypothetical protein
MAKNLYEVFDEFAAANTKEEKLNVLHKNWTPTLVSVLQLTYHPDIKWLVKDKPKSYKKPDTLPGVSYSSMNAELRRLYLFREGDPSAEKLTPEKREQLLLIMLESLEPREADVVIGIFKKNLGVKGLTYKFIRDNTQGVVP